MKWGMGNEEAVASRDIWQGVSIDEMIKLERGADPRPLIDQAIKKVETLAEEWLDGSDYIDTGTIVSGRKGDEIEIKEGIAVEIVHDYRDNTMYVRAGIKIEKADSA